MKHLEASSEFKRKHRKLIKNNKQLKDRINSTLIKLEENPFDFSLRTHSVNISKFGKVNSSSVTGDLELCGYLTKIIMWSYYYLISVDTVGVKEYTNNFPI